MKTIAIANQKGGVGKTTLSAHLGFAAAAANMRVLLVDFDPQGSLSIGSNVIVPDPLHLAASELFAASPVAKPLQAVDDHISIIPCDEPLFDMLMATTDVVIRARAALRVHAPNFDLCIIDTPPERNSLLVGALATADFVVTPMTVGLYEQAGVARLFNTIEGTRSQLNPRLRHLGILLMKTNSRSPKERKVLEDMRAQFGDYILPTELPERQAVRDAVNTRAAVWDNPRGATHEKAAREWRDACALVLTEMSK